MFSNFFKADFKRFFFFLFVFLHSFAILVRGHSDHRLQRLNNLFAFCEEVFPEGQELLILVTELTINYYTATFISRYGCDAYFAHNQELLFYERQQEIISQLESLELN